MTISESVGIKSRHSGLVSFIKASFRARDQLLICFSRVIADNIVGCLSTIKRTFNRYFRVNCEPIPFLCSRTLCRISDVTPVYNTLFLAFVSIYTHGSMFFVFVIPRSATTWGSHFLDCHGPNAPRNDD